MHISPRCQHLAASSLPILNDKTPDSAEFIHVMRDQGCPVCDGDGCDQQVIGPNRSSESFKARVDSAVNLRSGIIEWHGDESSMMKELCRWTARAGLQRAGAKEHLGLDDGANLKIQRIGGVDAQLQVRARPFRYRIQAFVSSSHFIRSPARDSEITLRLGARSLARNTSRMSPRRIGANQRGGRFFYRVQQAGLSRRPQFRLPRGPEEPACSAYRRVRRATGTRLCQTSAPPVIVSNYSTFTHVGIGSPSTKNPANGEPAGSLD